VAALSLMVLLLAPAPPKQWSSKHEVGVWIPKQWKIVARDQGDRAFVVEGPKLGPGVPRAVLWNAGPADLDQVAKAVAAKVERRPGWKIVTRARKRIGPFPCVRMGIRFLEDGAKGRARVTVALLGHRAYVLELSAAAAHFPGATFDRIEQSLEVRWSEHELGALSVKAPAGWERDGARLVLPPGGMVGFEKEPELRKPPESKPGPRVTFLGGRRETVVAEKGKGKERARLLLVHAGGWTAAVILPVALWDDLFPVAEAILKTAGVKKQE
jgi:hypothetical protein